MPNRKVRIQFEDRQGGRCTISLDGSVSRDQVLKIMDLVDILDVTPSEHSEPYSQDTTLGKLHNLIQERFSIRPFDSGDILESFEDSYQHPIKRSVVSTYLTRLSQRGFLTRVKTPSGYQYRRRPSNTPS